MIGLNLVSVNRAMLILKAPQAPPRYMNYAFSLASKQGDYEGFILRRMVSIEGDFTAYLDLFLVS